MEVLFTPWRWRYVARTESMDEECFLCVAARDEDHPLVIARTAEHVVLMNLHPYNSGHVMVAPRAHCATPAAVSASALAEFWPLVLKARDVVEAVYRPDGLNLGANLGRSAGAGVLDHFHFHVVPRWNGDANFMGAIGGARVVPEDPREACRRLAAAWAALSKETV
jgi:ATP adenylyltransferase